MAITNDPIFAERLICGGADRLFVDMELRGKVERQSGRSTVISSHKSEDISLLRESLPNAEILVRVNPFHEGSCAEVDDVVRRGADIVMLPMFRSPNEAFRFSDYVNGRARVCLLLETPQALTRLPMVLSTSCRIDEVYVGLNDLHIGLGLDFMFEVLAGGLVDLVVRQVLDAGLSVGFGGIGCVGSGAVPAELIMGEHVRLGSDMVILSRTFFQDGIDFEQEVQKLRTCEQRFRELDNDGLIKNQKELYRRIWQAAGVI